MASYAVLNAMPASAFLEPKNFHTDLDTPARCKEQYLKGVEIASRAKRVGVGAGGTWFADMKDGSCLTSYEGIGYHSGTADLWRGLLECENVVIFRLPDLGQTILKADGVFQISLDAPGK